MASTFLCKCSESRYLRLGSSAVRVIIWQQDHFNGRMEMTIDSLNQLSFNDLHKPNKLYSQVDGSVVENHDA